MKAIRYGLGVAAEQLLSLAQQTWPGTYTVSDVVAALTRTTTIGAWEDGNDLVGCVRVLAEGYFFATIPDILVLPRYRRLGIGSELMRRAIDVAPRGRLFFGAQPESVAFFEHIGCQRSLVGFEARRSDH